ncbi:MAG: DciA family protein [Sphingomonadales bacterium]|jgi:hypothetical protein
MPRKAPPAAPPEPPPRQFRARRIADIMPKVSGTAFARFGFTQTAIVDRWADIVGESWARHCRPLALSMPKAAKGETPKGGVLKIGVTGAVAPMLRHVEPQIIERANRVLGFAAVARLQLVQGGHVAEAAPVPLPAPQPLPEATKSSLKDIADPDLRASLESLAAALFASKGPPVIK